MTAIMPCYHPVTAWRSRDVNANGKRPMVFTKKNAQFGSETQLPCMNCIGCRLDHARSWQLRITHERPYWDLACFITLTYNKENLPHPPSLVKRDMQLFWKRLRKYHWKYGGGSKIKYFQCGEYGGNTNRPHYHAIIFGLDFADKRPFKKGKRGDQLYTSAKLDELWGLGFCSIGSVSTKSAGYVARYSLKKVNGEAAAEHYTYVDEKTGEISTLAKEFVAVSQGVGKRHFEDFKEQMYLRDSCILDGKQAPVPKYYDRLLGSENEEWLAKIKAERVERAKLNAANNTPERLRVREEVKKAQTTLLTRDLPDA